MMLDFNGLILLAQPGPGHGCLSPCDCRFTGSK